MVAGEQRHAGDPADQGGGDPGRPGGGDVNEVVGALCQHLDQVRETGDAEAELVEERDLQLGRRGQAPVHPGIGADDVDVEAGDPELADAFDRVGDAVHRADPVGDHRDPLPLPAPVAQLRLLGAEEGGRGRVGDRRHERLEEAVDGAGEVATPDGLDAAVDRGAQAPVVDAAGAAVEVGVGEAVLLEEGDQVAPAQLEAEPVEPGLQQSPGVLGPDVGGDLAPARRPFADHPFRHLQDRPRLGPPRVLGDLVAERPRRQGHRRVRPLRRAPLLPVGFGVAAEQVGEKLFRRRGRGHLGVGAADVDAGMVVGTADAGAAVRLDVDGGGHVQLGGPRAVADLPDREELRQSPPVAPGQRRGDVEEGMRQRAGDPLVVKVGGTGLDVAGMRLQPLVVSGSDPVTEDVNRLGLAGEAGGQLLGDEAVGTIGELEAAVDRVVVGDRDEVHPPPLGQLVDLLRRGRALRQPQRALDAQLRVVRSGRVAMHVNAGSHRCSPYLGSLCRLQSSL